MSLTVYSKCQHHSNWPANKKRPEAPQGDAGGCIFHYSPQYISVEQSKQHTDNFAFITVLPVVELRVQFVQRAALLEEPWGHLKQIV